MKIIETTEHVENIQEGYIIKSKYTNNHNTCKWTKLTNWKAEIFILENLEKKTQQHDKIGRAHVWTPVT